VKAFILALVLVFGAATAMVASAKPGGEKPPSENKYSESSEAAP